MSKRNPFHEDQPKEEAAGKRFANLSKAKVVRMFSPDGQVIEYVLSSQQSGVSESGHYADLETVNLYFDAAGNPLLESSTAISHSGLFIENESLRGLCTSMFHPSNLSRIVLLGQDGESTPTGAICSHCMRWKRLVNLILTIFGLAVLFGIYKATGFF